MFWNKKLRPFSELINELTQDKSLVFIENKSEIGLNKFLKNYDSSINKLNHLINIEEKTLVYHWHKESSSMWELESRFKNHQKIAFVYYEEDFYSDYITYPEKEEMNGYPFLMIPIGDYFKKNLINYKINHCHSIFYEIYKYYNSDIQNMNLDSILLINNKPLEIKDLVNEDSRIFYVKIEDKKVTLNSSNQKKVFSYE